ncbi:MAG: imidazole glycerol phosphate synthase subunit HisH [Coprobacillaceae bacterium]
MLVVIDYNVGNLQSVVSAFKRIGLETVVSRDHEIIKKAKAIVLPGVGSFPTAMNNLHEFDLVKILKDRKEAGIPILGICLGMQVLFEKGYEVKETKGLAFLQGEIRYMETIEKIPHMGWNQLHIYQKHPLTKYLQEDDEVYFVHSFMANCPKEQWLAYSDYGDLDVPAIVYKDNVMGCQFHPEKSGKIGAYILEAFKEMIG